MRMRGQKWLRITFNDRLLVSVVFNFMIYITKELVLVSSWVLYNRILYFYRGYIKLSQLIF
jgi:hypothetical protein